MMAEGGAFELKRGDRVYRAPGIEVLVRWAKDRRISAEDVVRKAGTPDWMQASALPDLAPLLDPANWWTVRIGEGSWIAQDFETIVRWTREGRLTTDAVIEGPRTPPGGVLAQGLPRLSPFLKPPIPREPGNIPPRLRIDGIEYFPAGVETVRQWIVESRIPPESEISLAGGAWEPVSECGLFEPEIWPAGAWGEDMPDDEPASPPAPAAAPPAEAGRPRAEGAPEPAPFVSPSPPSLFAPHEQTSDDTWRIVTLNEDFTIDDPSKILKLLKARRIHSFDDVINPLLPEGRCSVARAVEVLRLSRPRRFPWAIVWILVFLALGVVFVLVDPLDLNLLK
jgi:hypothetical protein